jgi:hypothetical protein
MKVHRELVFKGQKNAMKALLEAVERNLSDGWSRDRESEKTVGGISEMYCFSCDRRSGWPPSNLWIGLDPHRGARVVNIVPYEKSELTFDEYNAILLDFYRRFVSRVEGDFPSVAVQLSGAEADLSSWLSPTAVRLLRAFSALANKSSGSSHPADQERWQDFLIAAHREKSPMTASDLQRWLYEEEKWPDDQAAELAIEYEFARSLLKAYDHAI